MHKMFGLQFAQDLISWIEGVFTQGRDCSSGEWGGGESDKYLDYVFEQRNLFGL